MRFAIRPAEAERPVSTPVTTGAEFEAIRELRTSYLATLPSIDDMRRGGRIEAVEFDVPVAAGTAPAVLLRPAGTDGPLPVIFATANGGKVIQSVAVGMSGTELDWVERLKVAMFIVSCRAGPEHPHPAQVEDSYAGLIWMAERAVELGLDLDRLVLYGKSGGGGVAAATALYSRDHGGPAARHQLLIYPMLDDRERHVSSRFEGVLWDRRSNRTGWRAILGEAAGGPDVSAYAAAGRATELAGLPASYLEVGSADVFRDETLDYAARLGESGVPTEVHVWAGGLHAFELVNPQSSIAKQALGVRTNYLERALRPSFSTAR
ncbi:alpha/beta hydrolase fold domain-containing protein [Streptomyces shenzhenensis]|uniref:alpha/beta hydrolase fold domain-containing protein n=1 Tax=Streptomyces shenzhenensis TaxID=943815 RepID=UPI0033D1AE4A